MTHGPVDLNSKKRNCIFSLISEVRIFKENLDAYWTLTSGNTCLLFQSSIAWLESRRNECSALLYVKSYTTKFS